MISITTLILFIILLLIPYIYINNQLSYWKNRNIPYVKPIPIFGNILDIFLLKTNIAEQLSKIYANCKEPFIGIYMLHRPAILIKDPNLIKLFVIKHFDNFHDRTSSNSVDTEKDPDAGTSLVGGKYEIWKTVRKAVIPAFSYSNLKREKEQIIEKSQEMVRYISKYIEENSEINMRETALRYGIECIIGVFFGMEAECFAKKSPLFRDLTSRQFDYRVFSRGVKIAMNFISPTISRTFGLDFADKESGRRFIEAVQEELKRRAKNSERKDDYLQFLSDANAVYKGRGNLLFGSVETFIAGYEAISASLGFAFYNLAKDQEIQNKLREEILSNDSDFEELPYLDAFMKESFRMYPIVPFVDRVCTQDFQLDNPKLHIEEGTSVYIPIFGIHMDPEYYPEPHRFNPERFLTNNVNWKVYLPFGKGPRMCLAKRYSELVIKTALVAVVSNFTLKTCEKSTESMRFHSKGFSLQAAGDIFLRLEALKK